MLPCVGCGTQTERIFAVVAKTPNGVQEPVPIGLCLSCLESIANQQKFYGWLKAQQKMGTGHLITDELVGYPAKITKAGESGGEGETGIAVAHYVLSDEKLILVITKDHAYSKKPENIKRVIEEGGASTSA